MLLIQDKVVSLSVLEDFFCCDLHTCLGQCCIEGDAGAPVTEAEIEEIRSILPELRPYLTPQALIAIDTDGLSYIDAEGDLVTQLAGGRDCVFATYAPGGLCLCAIEKAYRDGKIPRMCKPLSCHLYPIRLKPYGPYTALNRHRWKICRSAESCGRSKGIRVYQALREPLVRAFGQEWYDELCMTAEEYLRQSAHDNKS